MVDFDRVDEQLVHALQVDGRASFSRIAEVLGASDRTIARRYHRLRETGAVRVVAVPSSPRLGWVDWLVRIQCAPDTAVAVAATMARRDDTSWVYLTSGGVEVTCITHTKGQRAPLMLPRGPRITSVTAQCMLRAVAGTAGWAGRTAALTQEQVDRLRIPTPEYDVPLELTAQDQRLMAELAKDARAAYPSLAAATGMPESTVRRRLGELLRAGAMYLDVEADPMLFGYATEAILWMSVAPSALTTVADALTQHPEIAYAAAVTGPTNLFGFVVCADPDALYDYLSERIGTLPGITHIETVPLTTTVKRAGTLLPRR
ncbi:DNA-binding Lrp family transcriptional regulator [Kribbella rubisoli]|uniref:DNA-binding Lrp family transcriptional regulator n=1 Tax=Kribbella rubisoli TaxID=3075929 RepID=A0A4Q7XBJ6_9ACTN|nr:AsnC family transcriptional regulator [Kribbella rubisoli]RZU20620.1 DNA-binding Lrp family transcriptional regulator [Kribbella rubisoli]